MAKDPAFLFYPGDFNTGTQFMTDEQVGKYMRLLMAQHQHGHLTDNHMIIICKSYDNDVMNKFKKDSAGLWYNERLENEVIKRKNYSESRGKNRLGKEKEKIISVSYDSHMENKNKDILSSRIINIGVGKTSIVVNTPYPKENIYRVFELDKYFDMRGQLVEITHAGWTKFTEFMKKNPGAVFNDANHLYNSFRTFSTTQKKKTGFVQ